MNDVQNSSNFRCQVALGADEKFRMPLAVTVWSLLRTLDPRFECDVFVLDGGLSAWTRRRLELMAYESRPKSKLYFLTPSLDDLNFASLPTSEYSPMTYLRLLLEKTLPVDVRSILYLDCDLLVRKSIHELWDGPNMSAPVQGVADFTAPIVASPRALPTWESLGLAPMAPYLNAGVLMINLDWWRTNGVSKTILDYLAKNHSTNRYADQDGINAILSPYAQLLHPQWNVPGYLDFDNHWGFVECPRAKSWLDACRSRLVDESAIIHFIGKRKPWDFRLSGDKLQMQWLQAFSKCQFDGFIPTLYTSMLARLGQVKRLLIKA